MPENENQRYAIFTIRDWNLRRFADMASQYPGEWRLFSRKEDLFLDTLDAFNPRYVFFPHWSWMVKSDILDRYECVCFHETDLPYGRGGSPIQNLIAAGFEETVVSAIRMTPELDAGDVYLKKRVSLLGGGEEVFLRISDIVAECMGEIAATRPVPTPQVGEPTYFARRTPDQSRLDATSRSLKGIFDHIRMLDVPGYPAAFLDYGNIRVRFGRPSLGNGKIIADATIELLEDFG